MGTRLTRQEIEKEEQKSEALRLKKIKSDKSLPEKMRKDVEERQKTINNQTIIDK